MSIALMLILLVQSWSADAYLTDLPGLSAHFFDVGQGDSTLLMTDDVTILIDAGRHDRNDVVPLLQSLNIEAIDLFILTHPHSDHIGQCDRVMHAFPVREVWLSGDVHTTRAFERCIDAILASEADYHEPRAGEIFHFDSVVMEVVHPLDITGDLNNGSISVKVIFGEIAFLFTGDSEQAAEASMIARGHDLSAHILHLGHHGSRTSSTMPFLEKVHPEVAIYSAGRDNSYGHPHPEVVHRIASLDIPLYGTDRHGTIIVITDGTHYDVTTERHGPTNETLIPDDPGGCARHQVNVNIADRASLTEIIHIGPALADRIIQLRPFHELDDLIQVSGIGIQRLDDIKDQGVACVAAS